MRSSAGTALPAGDADGDNRINLADFGLLVRYSNVNQAQGVLWPEAKRADFNGDGAVNLDDLFLIAQNFGEVGMVAATVSEKAGGGWASWDAATGEVRLHGSERVRGFAVLLEGHATFEEGALWAEHPFTSFHWQDNDRTRIVAALADPHASALGEGVVLVAAHEGYSPVQVEILDRRGNVLPMALRGARRSPW
jgi:hypothetical protein